MTIWELIALAKSGSGGASSVFHFKGSVLTENDLPATGEDGDTYLVDSADSYFAWDGGGWTDIGQLLTADEAREIIADLSDEVDDVKSAVNILRPPATASDVGKALIVKTVDPMTGKPSEYEYGEAGGSGGNVTTVALNISDAYDQTAKYVVGALCIKDNVLYKCNTTIATGGEAWNAAHWTQTTIADEMRNGSVSVSGTTPTFIALPGIRYVCGEVSTLDITIPASGIVDVVFESGSTATVLTITPPSGTTLKWANGFDPTALDANTIYEINIMDGLGVAVTWT